MSAAPPTLESRLARRLDYVRARQDLQRDLDRLLASGHVAAAAATGARVGIAALSSGPWHLALQILLGHALRLRGASTQLLTCDLPELPICNERLSSSTSIDRCPGCLDDKRELLAASQLPWERLSAFVNREAIGRAQARVDALDDDHLLSHREGNWPIGEWLHVSASHYLRRDGSGGDAEQRATRRRLLVSAMVTLQAIERWLDDYRPTVVIAQGGVHFMWRIVFELSRARGIPVVCREMGKGGWDHHLYALNRDSLAPDLDAAWEAARHEPLRPAEDTAVDDFLDQLPARTFAGANPVDAAVAARQERTLVAFTNVTWDMATAGRDAGFAGMAEWLRDTLRLCSDRPVRVIVRAHPAEAGNTREPVIDAVMRDWPGGRNLTFIPPGDPISAASLCAGADLVTVYNSTAGLEAAARGAVTLVAGRPHYRARGFTIDIASRDHYRDVLEAWLAGGPIAAPPQAAELARRYVHMFYLRYHVKMNWTTSPIEPPFALTITSMRELAPGAGPVLDLVCDGILHGRQVLLPREHDGVSACGR